MVGPGYLVSISTRCYETEDMITKHRYPLIQSILLAVSGTNTQRAHSGMASKGQSPSSWQPDLKRTWTSTCSGAVTSIALSSKGRVAVSTKSSVYLFEPPPSLALNKEIAAGSADITATAFSSKGTDVVSGGADGFLKWWQVETGEEVCVTQFPQAEGDSELAVQEVACSKGGFVAAVSGRYAFTTDSS